MDRGFQPPCERGFQQPYDQSFQPPCDQGFQPPLDESFPRNLPFQAPFAGQWMGDTSPGEEARTCRYHPHEDGRFSQAEQQWELSEFEILEYLLKKYRLDRKRVEATIIKNRIKASQYDLVDAFYRAHPELIERDRPIEEHYRIFCRWNTTRNYVLMDVLEDYLRERYRRNF